jgi:hypothetical protein
MGIVTYLHDTLHRADKEHEELQQVISVFLLQAVSAILAARSNDLCIIQAQVEISLEQTSMVANASALSNSNGDHLWIRFIAVLLLKLGDEEVNVFGSLLLSRLIKLDT